MIDCIEGPLDDEDPMIGIIFVHEGMDYRIDTITTNDVFVYRCDENGDKFTNGYQTDGSYMKFTRELVLDCIIEDQKRKNIKPKWPIRITHYMHDNKMGEDGDFTDKMMEHGLEENFIWDTFRYLIYEMELELDLYEDGSVAIVSIGNYVFPKPLTKWTT